MGAPRRIAFIQCVGSRDREHPYCSQVCCAYTLRLARLLKHRWPEAEVTTFYMDLQEWGGQSPKFPAEAHREVRECAGFARRPPCHPRRCVALRYLEEETGKPAAADFDLVVLAVGIGPGRGNPALRPSRGGPDPGRVL